MDRLSALQHFREQEVTPLLNHQLDLLEATFHQYQGQLITDVLASFRHLCMQIHQQQELGHQGPIGYIHYSLLRTQVLEQSYLYMMEAYSAAWYTDDSEIRCTYDASWAYAPLGQMVIELEQARKKYMGSIHPADVEHLVLELVPYFHQYVKALLHLALPAAIELPEYRGMDKANRLMIRTGEYRDYSESVYIEDLEVRSADERVEQLLQADEDKPCVYENLKQLVWMHLHISERDLRYNDFSHSELVASRFEACILIGSRWQYAALQESSFEGSLLTDADFRFSQLTNVSFRRASALARREGGERSPGLCGVRFEHACLDGVDFTDAEGFEHANFEGASMQGARVPHKYSQSWQLSELQSRSIIWTE